MYSVPLNSEEWETVAPIDTMGNKPLYPTNFNGVAVMALIDSGGHSLFCTSRMGEETRVEDPIVYS